MRQRIGGFEFDPAHRSLYRDSVAIPLKPLDFNLLNYLALHSERYVSSTELLGDGWPGGPKTQTSLRSGISRLRRILGQEAIEAKPSLGYRLLVIPEALESSMGSGILGRSHERAILESAVADIGTGGLLILMGEPGIGKSSLLRLAVERARSDGRSVIVCDMEPSPMALWPTILLSLDGAIDLPEHCATPTQLSYFDAVTHQLALAVQATPLLVAIDGLHLVDAASLDLMRFALRRLRGTPLLVVATYPMSPAKTAIITAPLLRALQREPFCRTVTLDPLDDRSAGNIVDRLVGASPDSSLRTRVLAKAGGNPLLLRKAVESELSRVDASPPSAATELSPCDEPPGNQHLDLLSPPCRLLLEAASVWEIDPPAEHVRLTLGWENDQFDDALEELKDAGLISISPLHFRHSSLRDKIYEMLDSDKKKSLHRAAAGALEFLIGSADPGDSLAELARHWHLGADANCAAHAINYLQDFGSLSLEGLRIHDAILHLEAALALLDTYHSEAAARRCQLLLALAGAYDRTGDRAGALQTYQRLQAAARGVSDGGSGVSPSTARFLAIAELGVYTPVDDRAVLRTRSAEAATRAADAAIDQARAYADSNILVSALVSASWRVMDVGKFERRIQQTAEIVTLSAARGDAELELEGRMLRIFYLLLAGNIREVDREIDAYASTVSRNPVGMYAFYELCLRCSRAHLDGRFDEAEERIAQIATAWAGIPADVKQGTLSGLLFAIRTSQGRTSETLSMLEMAVTAFPTQLPVRICVAGALCELGRFEEARAHFDVLAAHNLTGVLNSQASWFSTANGLARICNRLEARREANILYQHLLPYAGCCVVSPLGHNFYGSSHGYLALFAATAGRVDEALAHFESSHRINAGAYAWPVRAHMQYEHARVLRQRNQNGDGERIRSLLHSARVTASDMKMTGLLQWIDSF